MLRLGSSLRSEEPATTLQRAQAVAATLGIVRVPNITWLDRIGIPVFVGIRPNAVEGSIGVSAGKGLTALEASISAYMEAIEFAAAEPQRGKIDLASVTCSELLDGSGPEAVLELGPIAGREIDTSAP